MGTIVERSRKGGSIAYMAQIAIMREGVIVHRESKTFDRKASARAWIGKREEELSRPDARLGVVDRKRNPTLSDAIDRYLREMTRPAGRTKKQVLATLKTLDIAEITCIDLRSQDIVSLAATLRRGRSPSTVLNYLSHLAPIFEVARPAWGWPLDPQVLADAHSVCRRLGHIAKSRVRSRLPALEELDCILSYFSGVKRVPGALPMVAITVFALFSTRRQAEITRLSWDDLDVDYSRILVRNMKDPDSKDGNDVWCELPATAMRIIQAMPQVASRIFPFDEKSISTAFTRACAILGIDDLHFHDLRHAGVTRLFEMGFTIPLAASVSGHRSWQSLQRYTHVRARGDAYEGWPWIERAVAVAAELPEPLTQAQLRSRANRRRMRGLIL